MNHELIGCIVGILVIGVSAALLWFRKYKGNVIPILDDADKVIEIVQRLFDIYYNDDQIKDKAEFYIDMTHRVVDEVRFIFGDNADAKKTAIEIVYRLLRLLGETPTAKHHQLISETIAEALAQLEQQK